jgi:hypothetical protein
MGYRLSTKIPALHFICICRRLTYLCGRGQGIPVNISPEIVSQREKRQGIPETYYLVDIVSQKTSYLWTRDAISMGWYVLGILCPGIRCPSGLYVPGILVPGIRCLSVYYAPGIIRPGDTRVCRDTMPGDREGWEYLVNGIHCPGTLCSGYLVV